MKQTRILMDMPITVEVVGSDVPQSTLDDVFAYFERVEDKFSTFREDSQISLFNQGKLALEQLDEEVVEVLDLCQQTSADTFGYFDIFIHGRIDPAGLVKGWAIRNAAEILAKNGLQNYFVSAGGDIQVAGKNIQNNCWTVGIQDPLDKGKIIKKVKLTTEGIATSGTYQRGQHIVNPHQPEKKLTDTLSLTVIGPDIYEADRFATAAFAMGSKCLDFISSRPELAAFTVDHLGKTHQTDNFNQYVV